MSATLTFLNKKFQKFPVMAVLFTQVFVLFFLRNSLAFIHFKISPLLFVLTQALISAFIIKKIFRLPHWLMTISLLLPVLFFVAFTYLPQSSAVYGVGFVVLALTFSHTLKERVPLYLTNVTTAHTLRELIQKNQAKKAMDLGSGLGGVVRAMALPEVESTGVESAPMLWLVSSLLCLFSRKGKILRKNIWKTDLKESDLVYAFLSPAIMEELWEKVQREMRPGTLFISNSFVVPGVRASEMLTLNDARKTKLYLYRMK